MMKKFISLLVLCLLAMLPCAASSAAPLDATLFDLQQRWAVVKYQTPDKEQQKEAIAGLVDEADEIVKNNPGKADPLIWQAIIISTQADIESTFASLAKIEHAKEILLAAEKINPKAMRGEIYVLLGAFYYQMPGAPLSFGDDDTAREYLEKAIALNPNGLDANYFYGDFLNEQGESAKAKAVLTHALAAPIRPKHEVADTGRHQEVEDALAKIDPK